MQGENMQSLWAQQGAGCASERDMKGLIGQWGKCRFGMSTAGDTHQLSA